MIQKFQDASRRAAGIQDAAPPSVSEPLISIFISESLGEGLLKQAVVDAQDAIRAGHSVRLVLRGFLPGETYKDSMTRNLRRLQKWNALDVPLQLDPPAFKENMIVDVPTAIRTVGDKVTDRVSGTVSASFIINQRKHNPRGDDRFIDHSKVGELFEIAEEDLMQRMQSTLANMDWKAKARTALDRYWRNKKYVALPPATKDRHWTLNPSIRINEDMYANNQLMHKAGKILNPFDAAPLVTHYLVFNPTRSKELEYAKEMVSNLRNKSLILMATELPQDKPLEKLMELQDYARSAIYLLSEDVQARFSLKATPTYIQPNNIDKVFNLSEVSL